MVLSLKLGGHDGRLGSALREALQKHSFSDVVLICPGGGGSASISAHRTVLALFSEYFSQRIDQGYIIMPEDFDPQTLRSLVGFLYSGEVSAASEDDLTKMRSMADTLGIEIFKEATIAQDNNKDKDKQALSVPPPVKRAIAVEADKELGQEHQHLAPHSPPPHKKARKITDYFGKTDKSSGAEKNSQDAKLPSVVLTPLQIENANKKKSVTHNQDFRIFCPREFDREERHATHEESHGEEEGRACPVCAAVYFSEAVLMAHVTTAHQDHQTMAQEEKVTNGKEDANQRAFFDCCECEESFDNPGRLKIHQVDKHQGQERVDQPVHKCGQCPKVCRNLGALKMHLSLHSDGNKNAKECPVCHIVVEVNRFREHVRSKHNFGPNTSPQEEGAFSCDKCPKICLNEGALKGHSRVHAEGSGGKECTVCKVVVTKNGMAEHMRKSHNIMSSEAKCPCCPKICSNSYALTLHLKAHADKLDHVKAKEKEDFLRCDKCPRVCKNEGALKRHSTLHAEGSTAKECPMCNVVVGTSSFGKHMQRQHEMRAPKKANAKEGSFRCEKCPRVCQNLANLNRHSRLHAAGHTARECPECKMLVSTGSFGKHMMRKHGKRASSASKDKKGLRCDKCPRVLSTVFNLNKHMALHGKSSANARECPECKFIVAATRFSDHMRKKHNVSLEATYNHKQVQNKGLLAAAETEGKDVFHCIKCTRTCQNESALKSHLRVHEEGHAAKECPVCKVVVGAATFASHMKHKHNTKVPTEPRNEAGFQCGKCPRICKDLSGLKSHFKLHEEGSSAKECPECKVVVGAGSYSEHMMKKHKLKILTEPKKALNCDKCPRICKDLSGLKSHSKVHEDGYPSTKCPFCMIVVGKRSFDEHMLRKHKKVLKETKPKAVVKCDKCPRVLTTKNHLEQHMGLHRRGNALARECLVCKAVFNINNIRAHMAKEHGRQEEKGGPVKCDKCPRICRDMSRLNSHMSLHSKGNALARECPVCKAVYYVKHLKDHIGKVHGGGLGTTPAETTIKCPKCPRICLTQSHFDTHSRLHEAGNASARECSACAMVVDFRDFARHMRTHNTDNDNSNSTNDSSSNSSNNNSNNSTTTTNSSSPSASFPSKQMFGCGSCEKQFGSRFALHMHVKKRHGNAGPNSTTSGVGSTDDTAAAVVAVSKEEAVAASDIAISSVQGSYVPAEADHESGDANPGNGSQGADMLAMDQFFSIDLDNGDADVVGDDSDVTNCNNSFNNIVTDNNDSIDDVTDSIRDVIANDGVIAADDGNEITVETERILPDSGGEMEEDNTGAIKRETVV